MRKALIVGIDHYKHHNSLNGCVNDARAVNAALERHGDGTVNFDTRLLTASGDGNEIVRRRLKDTIEDLFRFENEAIIFYFSGHGHIENAGGYLITSECGYGDEGVSMDEVLHFANTSPAKHKVIILDCCHSGMLGAPVVMQDKVFLSKGVTILTASSAQQYASEKNGSGVFTNLLVDALNGAAASLTGDITPGSVYAHIDKSLGPWQQRPVFRANIENFITLKTVQPPIPLRELLKITELFNEKDTELALDPTYEPTSETAIADHVEKFDVLQQYNRVNLVIPAGAKHMYDAAMESKGCTLTMLGRHYWKLVKNRRL